MNCHIKRPKRPGCPCDVPNLFLGRFWGILTTKFLYVIFLYRFFFLSLNLRSLGDKGRFRKRVLLANVPSFRFSFRGNMRTYPRSGFRSGGTSECTLVPVFVPGEHPPKPPFWRTTLLGSPEMNGKQKSTKGSVIFFALLRLLSTVSAPLGSDRENCVLSCRIPRDIAILSLRYPISR